MISILLTLRKNSKFFSKFLIGYLKHTKYKENIELLILANKEDTWNKDWFEFYKLNVFYEDWNCGKNGRHLFFNHLAEKAHGDWLWHMCDDHYLLDGYDEYLTNYIKDNQIDSQKINIIVPRVENSGSISHLISRGWYKSTGRIGCHGNIDSYLNELLEAFSYQSRIYHPDQPILYDYTVDEFVMTPKHSEIELNPSYTFYDFTAPETKDEIKKDLRGLYEGIQNGA